MIIGAALICSDESCAETVEVVARLDDLVHLSCEGCHCTLTVLAVWEVQEARRAPSLRLVREDRHLPPLAA